MKKIAALLALALCAIAVGAGTAAAGTRTVNVTMRDPGCHWFLVGGKYLKTLSVTGPVFLLNTDMAALRLAGASGVEHDAVGKKLLLARGTYHITMVGQAPDDNHLLLVVR
jgi:hypothetical protein